jgi:hypothetical protein
MKTVSEIRKAINQEKVRSAWERGVNSYASEILDTLADAEGEDREVWGSPADKKAMLNGAGDWNQYSWGGCSYAYDRDIAETLCSPSELKKTRNGARRPNANEEWLDVQARALFQASNKILRLARA